jgi:ubiquinone/menaquinone biosynthesis C-methylase UbiE
MSWQEQAENWILWARSEDDSYWHYRDAFFELVPAPGERTLEVGCGEGRVVRDLRSRGHDVVGVDAVAALVEAARELDSGGEYVVADAADLPFEDESFDLAVAYNSLMDMDDMSAAVRELARVLRPGSPLCACVTHPVNDAGRFEPDDVGGPFLIDAYRGRRRYDETFERFGRVIRFVGWCYPLEGYTRALEEAGFLIESIREPPIPHARVETWPRAERRLRIPNFLMLRALKPA